MNGICLGAKSLNVYLTVWNVRKSAVCLEKGDMLRKKKWVLHKTKQNTVAGIDLCKRI